MPRFVILLVVTTFLMLGYVVGQSGVWERLFSNKGALYQGREFNFAETEFALVDWKTLLGNEDKALFEKLRQQTKAVQNVQPDDAQQNDKMEADLLLSALKANTWHSLDGYQVNEQFHKTWIEIPGFIVPLELDEQRLLSFFIVPYYGACLHFPPPPPNQIIYVRLNESIDIPSIQTPFLFSGRLVSELFEDPLGTSAWSLDVVQIANYQGEADTARLHQ